jgi:hypothetical protein
VNSNQVPNSSLLATEAASADRPFPAGSRMLTEHRVNPANDVIAIHVMDAPGAGGANHHYMDHSTGLDAAPRWIARKGGVGHSISERTDRRSRR